MNILVAEDERDIRELLTLLLTQEGYRVYAAADGGEALGIFDSQSLDLAVLDVMMPRLDGFNLLRKIRETSELPVLFLTARGEEMDKVLGFGLGADDYLLKPFSSAELIARIAALLRRSRRSNQGASDVPAPIVAGDLCLDLSSCCVKQNGRQVELNAKEFLLLKHLMENPDRVFTKKQLYRSVWEEDTYFDDNTVMVHISRLRNKIEPDPKEPVYIRTIRGIGYKFQKQPGDER
jgi:DNA-binding response OmpR family regulator